jgi:Transposase IS116/IS110/IS902 family
VAIETSRGLLVACLRATGPCRPTASWSERSRCWPAPSKTPSGTAPWPTTGCAACCASSTRRSVPPWPASAVGCYAQRPRPSWWPLRPRPRQPDCRWRSCGRCSPELADAVALTARHAGCGRSCAPATCTSHRWWSRRWAARRWRCCASWRPPAPAPRNWPPPPSPSSLPTPTPSSSPAAPGLGPLTGARVLAEVGDDRSRFADARAVKAYAGAAPVTRASGKSHQVSHRRVKNQRLAAAGYVWAFSALTASPGARAHHQRRRAAGDRHIAAQRNLFNRLLGCLHHCLQTRTRYSEQAAFPTRRQPPLDRTPRGMSR